MKYLKPNVCVEMGLKQWKLDGLTKMKDICSGDHGTVQIVVLNSKCFQKESQPPSSQVPEPRVHCQDLPTVGDQHQGASCLSSDCYSDTAGDPSGTAGESPYNQSRVMNIEPWGY